MVTLKLPMVCISNDKCRRIPHSSNHKMHWAVKYKWNEEWSKAMQYEVMLQRKAFGKLPLKFAEIVIKFHCIREIDRDNMFNAAKPLIDALKDQSGCGVIIDDKQQYAHWECVWHRVDHRIDEHVELIIKL